ncbi:LysR family transcriptional regulator [Streptomyces sp. TG1A-8]|nr:LysR family transcriptional regulator [Streptomyces sp. TG1A-8]MDO0924991.1 LysR family transcriptional regulator [Streptomyces sp. TG1A-8]
MELRHLRYFLAVADTHSFTRAARRCFVAQSALSQQIARLEAELGTALFARTSRTVRLTEAGRLMVPLAERVLADADEAVAQVRALVGLRRGRLRLGVIQTMAAVIDMVAVLDDFHRAYPDIELQVVNDSSSQLVEQVATGSLDVAVVGWQPEELPPTLGHRLLGQDPLVVVVSADHLLAGNAEVSLDELPGDDHLIQFRRGSGLRQHVEAAFSRAGARLDGSIEVAQVQDMVRLAARDVGVAVVPLSATAEVPNGARVLRLTDPLAVQPVTLAYDIRGTSPAVNTFLDTVQHHLINR